MSTVPISSVLVATAETVIAYDTQGKPFLKTETVIRAEPVIRDEASEITAPNDGDDEIPF